MPSPRNQTNRAEQKSKPKTILQRKDYSVRNDFEDQATQDSTGTISNNQNGENVSDIQIDSNLNQISKSSTQTVVNGFVELIRKECNEALKLVRHSLDRRELGFKLKILNERWATIESGLKSAVNNGKPDIETIHRAGCLEVEPIYRETCDQLQNRIEKVGIILNREPNMTVDETGKFKCNKFEYLAARSQIGNILTVSPTKCNDHKSLSDLVQVISGALNQLKGTSLNVMELFVINAIEEKLDLVTRTEWLMKCEKKAPTLKKLLEYLDKRSRVLSTLSASPTFEQDTGFDQTLRLPSVPSTSRYDPIDHPKSGVQRGLEISNRSSNQQYHRVYLKPGSRSAKQKPYDSYHRPAQRGHLIQPRIESNNVHRQFRPCVLCGGDHGLFKCGRFLNLSVGQRSYVVKKNRLCINCLGPFHNLSQCRVQLVECPRCPLEHHNSVLCKRLHM